MNLHKLLQERAALGGFIRVGMIGAGKFGTMYLAQSRNLAGIHIAAIADLNPERAHNATSIAGWDPVQSTASSLTDAITTGKTFITDDAEALIAEPNIDIVIDATGDPRAGIRHVHTSCREQKDIVMVNVEADALAGPQLAREADEAGIIYSLAYGDQPALICELVDWARTSGFEVVAAGKGTKYLPIYHQSTPETVWEKYGISASEAKSSGMNPRMFNSFIDGTKSAIEMAAVANAAQLKPPPNGLLFPPCSVNDLANTLRPKSSGGQLFQSGQVEVVSSLDRYGQPITEDLRWGVFVVFRDSGDYASRCFAEYGLPTDESGEFAALYRPYHLVGLELGISIASVALRKEPTGVPRNFTADVVAIAKRDLRAGEKLDGEGGYTVWGKLIPAKDSIAKNALPIGLASGIPLKEPIAAGEIIPSSAVCLDSNDEAVSTREALIRNFSS